MCIHASLLARWHSLCIVRGDRQTACTFSIDPVGNMKSRTIIRIVAGRCGRQTVLPRWIQAGCLAGCLALPALLRPMQGAEAYLADTAETAAVIHTAVCQPAVVEVYDATQQHQAGEAFEKVVQFCNEGTTECCVRARILFSDSRAESASKLSADGVNFVEPAALHPTETSADGTDDGWIRSGTDPWDGYYYYKPVLEPGGTTTPLLRAVRSEKRETWQGEACTIYILCESVQAKNPEGSLSAAWTFREAFAAVDAASEAE